MRTRPRDLATFPIERPAAARRGRAAQVVAFALLACSILGCATRLTISSRDGQSQGTGTARGLAAVGFGEMTVVLDGKVYTGQWAVVPEGTTGLGLISSCDGSSSLGFGLATSAKYPGSALLRSDDGHMLRCEFLYSEVSGAGTGASIGADERMYDLT